MRIPHAQAGHEVKLLSKGLIYHPHKASDGLVTSKESYGPGKCIIKGCGGQTQVKGRRQVK
jgi:hypothetical protein